MKLGHYEATVCAFTLAAAVGFGAPAEASIITIHASGAIGGYSILTSTVTSGPLVTVNIPAQGGFHFGLSPGSFSGAHADFTWTIDTDQLGASLLGPNNASWGFHDTSIPLAPLTSLFSIGITGKVTINGITVTSGLNRQALVLTDDPAGDGLFVVADTLRNQPQPFSRRDWVDLNIGTLSPAFLTSLNPIDLASAILPSCGRSLEGPGQTWELALVRYQEGYPPTPSVTRGAVDLCAESSRFSIEVTEAPEPSGMALIGMALFSLLGLGTLRRRTST